MKKNRTLRIAVLMLALTLLTCCFVGSTFAKYTSQATGSATVSVAHWDIEFNGEDITAVGSKQTVDFTLFSTINDTLDGNDETDVIDNKIAPGTKGSFTYTINNKSEVNAKYSIVYEATTSFEYDLDGDTNPETYTVPIVFSLNGSDWKENITELNVTGEDIAMTNGNESITVYWQWDFDGDDTAIGLAAQNTADEIKVSITLTVEQVD